VPLTPATLPRHELIGLSVSVAAASDPGFVGVAGDVIGETTRTLSIEGPTPSAGRTQSGASETIETRVWQVPKADATFAFALGEAGTARQSGRGPTAGGQVVTVDGARLVARPARRTEHTGDSKWR
jgi:ribonuclease P protein subunit POP4